jgi:mono/diheme cytochrome c family protein
MNPMKSILCLAALVLTMSVAMNAQEDDSYETLMKSVAATAGSIGKNLDAKSGAAVADAKKLEEIFGEVRAFWEKRNASDAVKFAADAQAGFKQVGELSAAGKWEEAAEALKTARTNCAGCHSAHREKGADGEWMIK